MNARRSALASIAVLGLTVSCPGLTPVGSACSSTSECETGLSCLYPLGSGCGASGQCLVPSSDCSGTIAGLSLCGCGGAPLNLSCVPSIVALPQRTATGPACLADAGADAGDSGQ